MKDKKFEEKLEKHLPKILEKLIHSGRLVIRKNEIIIKPSMCRPIKKPM